MIKPTYRVSIASIALCMILVSFLLVGCGGGNDNSGSPLPPQMQTFTRSINAFSASNTPVATFNFQQITQGTSSTVTYSVKNLTNTAMCVTFSTAFQLNAATWTAQGSVSNLAPGATVNEGQISTNPARIDLGALAVQFTSDPSSGCVGSVGNNHFTGQWGQVDFFNTPPNNLLGTPATTGFLSFNIAASGAMSVNIIYLNEATGVTNGFKDTASGTLTNAGVFTGAGSNSSGNYKMTGQITSTTPEPGTGRPQVTFTFTVHFGNTAAADIGPYTGTARM